MPSGGVLFFSLDMSHVIRHDVNMTTTTTPGAATMNTTTTVAELTVYCDPNYTGLAWSYKADWTTYSEDLSGAYGPDCEDDDEAAAALKDLYRQMWLTSNEEPWNIEGEGVNVEIDYNDGGCITISGDADKVKAFAAAHGIDVK